MDGHLLVFAKEGSRTQAYFMPFASPEIAMGDDTPVVVERINLSVRRLGMRFISAYGVLKNKGAETLIVVGSAFGGPGTASMMFCEMM